MVRPTGIIPLGKGHRLLPDIFHANLQATQCQQEIIPCKSYKTLKKWRIDLDKHYEWGSWQGGQEPRAVICKKPVMLKVCVSKQDL